MRVKQADILVVGSGIAGLSFALRLCDERPDLRIVVATKGEFEEGSTRYAQGGIAVVLDNLRDNFESHISDTIAASGGFADPEIVDLVIKQAPDRLHELELRGAEFDKKAGGQPDLALEGGHSAPRVVHSRDSTGREVARTLSAAAHRHSQIEILTHHFAIDLYLSGAEKRCAGVFFLTADQEILFIGARFTMLATGGCGQLFTSTTNPLIATGDGVAMAQRAGALICDLQTMQFHPTALYHPGSNPSFLLSEALRGFGAHIINEKSERFLHQSDPRAELATRDVVTRAIWKEMRDTGKPCVYLDLRHLDATDLNSAFPAIMAHCRQNGIEPVKQPIPIAPAAHYQCGGILTDIYGRTIIKDLLAAGECASTGLHGRNRLASNSLLEALVFAYNAALFVAKNAKREASMPTLPVLKQTEASFSPVEATGVRKSLRQLMSDFFMGTVNESRVRDFCRAALQVPHLSFIPNDSQSLELRNLIELSILVAEQAAKNEILSPSKRQLFRKEIQNIWKN